jgi:anti-sigma regulatory factor (Ser/Thr protein kinase)
MDLFDTICVGNNLQSLLPANALVERYCAHYHFCAEARHDMLLLLEEVLANIVNHAYDDALQHSIEISIYHSHQYTEMRFTDDGKAFNPLGQPQPELGLPIEQAPIGGLGLTLLRQLSDAIHYQRTGKYNILTLRCNSAPNTQVTKSDN